jgi:hypothetical protein
MSMTIDFGRLEDMLRLSITSLMIDGELNTISFWVKATREKTSPYILAVRIGCQSAGNREKGSRDETYTTQRI